MADDQQPARRRTRRADGAPALVEQRQLAEEVAGPVRIVAPAGGSAPCHRRSCRTRPRRLLCVSSWPAGRSTLVAQAPRPPRARCRRAPRTAGPSRSIASFSSIPRQGLLVPAERVPVPAGYGSGRHSAILARWRRPLPGLALTPEVIRAALEDPDLRRLQASWMAVNAGMWAFLVTNLVVAYGAGGAVAIGLLGRRLVSRADRGVALRRRPRGALATGAGPCRGHGPPGHRRRPDRRLVAFDGADRPARAAGPARIGRRRDRPPLHIALQPARPFAGAARRSERRRQHGRRTGHVRRAGRERRAARDSRSARRVPGRCSRSMRWRWPRSPACTCPRHGPDSRLGSQGARCRHPGGPAARGPR